MSSTQLKMNRLAAFREQFKELHEKWGYRFEADPNYEDLTAGDLRQFQHLTDYLMRFLEQGGANSTDVKTMIGVDFYVRGRDFNVSAEALEKYLRVCGPFYTANEQECKDAKEFLKTCPPSIERCLLTVSLKWTSVVRKYVRKQNKGKEIRISSFTREIKETALQECEKYLKKVHNRTLQADNIEAAIEEVQKAEEIRDIYQRIARGARTNYVTLRF